MTKISGIYAATMSVLNPDLSLNVKKTIEHAEKLIDEGCHGTAIFGSTGQSQLISVSEKIISGNSPFARTSFTVFFIAASITSPKSFIL